MGGHLSHLEREPHSDEYILEASCGPVRGNIYKNDDKIVDGFLGIPYAKPPIRFQKPEPALLWLETRDCTKYGPVAPASGGLAEHVPAEFRRPGDEENCLTINVFSPRWESKEFKDNGRPVMVFIHGGGFEFGASADYDDYSISGTLPLKDVVVVTFNYRLGVLGFLTTGDKKCLGNFGLWDQTLALTWVQKHIRSFAGNPGNVTVFGQSAGAASTELLSLSPHSRDLFHKFVPISGSAYCDFAIRSQKDEALVFEEFAKHKGFDGEGGSDALLEWYKEQPTSTFAEYDNFKKSVAGNLDFTPNLDGDFFPKPLEKLRKSAPKIPVMLGVCEYEGLMFAFLNPNFVNAKDEIQNQTSFIVKDEEQRNQISEYYTKELVEEDEAAAKKKLVELVSDYMFNLGILDSARSLAKHGNDVYLYTFEYYNPEGFGTFADVIPFLSAMHCTDVRYIIGEGLYSKFDPNDADLKMIDKMTTIYTNFAKYGNPNEAGSFDWFKYNPENDGQHYRITGDEEGNESGMVDEYHGNRWKFLDQIVNNLERRKTILNGK